MPICLKCGKAIEPGKKYCDDCGELGKEQVQAMFKVVEGSPYKKRRQSDRRWLYTIALIVILLMVAVAVALYTMMPSGDEFTEKAQAAVCRANLSRIQTEIASYLEVEGEYPPTGRLDSGHDLVVDRYLEEPLKCPATDRYYVLVEKGSKVVVICDSKKEKHQN